MFTNNNSAYLARTIILCMEQINKKSDLNKKSDFFQPCCMLSVAIFTVNCLIYPGKKPVQYHIYATYISTNEVYISKIICYVNMLLYLYIYISNITYYIYIYVYIYIYIYTYIFTRLALGLKSV